MKSLLLGIVSVTLFSGVFITTSSMRMAPVEKPVSNEDSLWDTTALVWGIDLSHHQKNVNWDQIECEKPYFIFFKATEGATHTDRMYHQYKMEAADRDIKVGSYHFFSYTTSGKDQALHFLKTAHITRVIYLLF